MQIPDVGDVRHLGFRNISERGTDRHTRAAGDAGQRIRVKLRVCPGQCVLFIEIFRRTLSQRYVLPFLTVGGDLRKTGQGGVYQYLARRMVDSSVTSVSSPSSAANAVAQIYAVDMSQKEMPITSAPIQMVQR